MGRLTSKDGLDSYIDDLVLYRQDHENDDPIEIAGALIYAIQTRQHFNEEFKYYLKNVSYTEKKRIKSIIEYNSTHSNVPLTQEQETLFAKLVESLPKDSVAKSNEERRKHEDKAKAQTAMEFLDTFDQEISKLKRKLGEECRKQNIDEGDNDKVKALTQSIQEMQAQVLDLVQNTNPTIQKKARALVKTFEINQSELRSEEVEIAKERFQEKITNINNYLIEVSPPNDQTITSEDLKRIQERLANNNYAFNYHPDIRKAAGEVLKQIEVIRKTKLGVVQGEEMSFLEALQHHKAWSSGSQFDLKYGKFTPEHISEGFYVMRGETEGDKNDVKMHVSIHPDDAKAAMDIICEIANKYPEVIHEFKIGDIEHIQQRIISNKETASTKLKQLFSVALGVNPDELQGLGINVESILKELIENPDKEAVIRNAVANIPDEKRNLLGNQLQDVLNNNINAIIAGERILYEALFTVYFKKDISKDQLKQFTDELSQKLTEKNVRPGQTASTDVSANPYCKITIDHIVENGKKVYLEGSDPKAVEKRQKALRENPLTEEIVSVAQGVPMHVSRLQALAQHEDAKDLSGMSAFIGKSLTQIPLEERIDFAGVLIQERFKYTKNVNLVYRNPEMFAKWMVKEILGDLKFPVDPNDKKVFFELVQQATATPVDEVAKARLQAMFNEPNDLIVKMLLPFYHDYLEAVKKEFDENYKADETRPKDEQRRDYYDAREKRLNEAKKQFIGHVSFPFVESLVFELMEKDEFNPQRKGKLAQAFRVLREGGMMDPLKDKLDKANQGYIPPKSTPETINQVYQVYQKGKTDFIEFQKEHRDKMKVVEDRATELYKIVNKIASFYPKDSPLKSQMEAFAGSIENIKTELDHMLLRGEKITDKDINEVLTHLDRTMREVNDQINTKNDRGETVLHEAVRGGNKDVVEALIKAGADPNQQTTHYTRGPWKAFKEMLSGQKSSITAIELARKIGDQEVMNAFGAKVIEPSEQSHMMQELDKVLVVDNQDEEKIEDIIDQPKVVQYQSKRESVKHDNDGPFYESGFAAGWIDKMDSMLKEYKYGEPTTQLNKAIGGLIKELQNYMTNFMASKSDITQSDLDKLKKVIERVEGQFFSDYYGQLPPSVKDMLDKMKQGVVSPSQKPVQLHDVKTDFVQKWEKYLGEMEIESNARGDSIQQIKNWLNKHPETNPPYNVNGFEDVLSRIETLTQNKDEDLQKMISQMRKGDLPEDRPKSKLNI